MGKRIHRITETALMLALLISLQALTKGFGQLVTGSCVNAILAISVLLCGPGCGLTLSFLSPVLAFLLGIAPNFITVLPIMLGNCCYVLVLHLLLKNGRKPVWKLPVALGLASVCKAAVLYLLVVKIICGAASGLLLGKTLGKIVILAPPMLELLPAMFSLPQLLTALMGGTAALIITPVLEKALHK